MNLLSQLYLIQIQKKIIENEEHISELAWFLNSMHYGRPLKTFGYVLFGFVAVAVMFLIIGGLIQVTLIKYKDKGKTNKVNFLFGIEKSLLGYLLLLLLLL